MRGWLEICEDCVAGELWCSMWMDTLLYEMLGKDQPGDYLLLVGTSQL